MEHVSPLPISKSFSRRRIQNVTYTPQKEHVLIKKLKEDQYSLEKHLTALKDVQNTPQF
jgi:hypothetical protein